MKLPKGWRFESLEESVDSLESGVSVVSEGRVAETGEFGVLKVNAVWDGRFRPRENKAIPPEELKRAATHPQKGCVIISRSNTPELVGAVGFVEADFPQLYLPDTLWQMSFRPQAEVDGKWICYVLASRPYRKLLQQIASGTSANMKKLQKPSLLRVCIPLPPLPEQKRVAEILGSWDRAIEMQQNLLTAKTTRLRTLRHQLLTGANRFPEFQTQGVWPRTRLEKAAEEMNDRNKGNVPDHKLFAVTKAEGLVPMKDRVKGISTQRCMVVEQDWYAYNPMRINIGSIARHYSPEPVMVSPDYVVFRAKPAVLLPDYLDHLRRSQLWSDFVSNAGSGSVRVRIYFDALGLLSFPLPTLAEQNRIAAFLNACQREIDLLTTQLEALKQQKCGIMQKLLTGEIRIH